MQIGMVGLGRMGGNMATRLVRGGHAVVAYDPDTAAVDNAASGGATGVHSLEELIHLLAPRSVVWVMVPDRAVQPTVDHLATLMSRDDVLIDGGNSKWTDTMVRAELLRRCNLAYVDVGTSGGIWGLEDGYCMMVGGDAEIVRGLAPIFDALASPPDSYGPGWLYVGRSGSGHYTKMVHNGIEYGMMQALAEGFAVLHGSEFFIDNEAIARLWMHGSVVRSWLLELSITAFAQEGNDLAGLAPYVEDSGEGRWMLEEAIDRSIPTPAIAAALFARFASRGEDDYSARYNAGLRRQFGGHSVKRRG